MLKRKHSSRMRRACSSPYEGPPRQRPTPGQRPPFLWKVVSFFLNILEDMSPFCGATDTPVSDFWWHVFWVSKPEWVLPYSSLAEAYMLRYMCPEIHLWCNTCQPLGSQHGSQAISSTYLRCIGGTRNQELSCHRSHCEIRQTLYWLSYPGSALKVVSDIVRGWLGRDPSGWRCGARPWMVSTSCKRKHYPVCCFFCTDCRIPTPPLLFVQQLAVEALVRNWLRFVIAMCNKVSCVNEYNTFTRVAIVMRSLTSLSEYSSDLTSDTR